MHKASIAIFANGTASKETRPEVPDVVFEAVKRVMDSKGSELLKTPEGMYVVAYSESGPFSAEPPHKHQLPRGWLPVYVAKIVSWTSGGVKTEEMAEQDPEFATSYIESFALTSSTADDSKGET